MKGSTSYKKVLSLILAFTLSFLSVSAFSGCDKEPVTEHETEENITEAQPVPGGSLAVPYTSADSLNPFYCETTINNSLSSLIYRSLYYLDTSFAVHKDMAASETFSGLILKVRLINDLVFSDGSPVTSGDVVYSFENAKKSYFYSEVLKGIKDCTAEDTSTLVFNLSYADVNVLNALTFPIVKKGTATTESSLPLGSGYYYYTEDGIRLSLTANLSYAGKFPAVGNIRLVDVAGNKVPEHLVDTGEIDFCYSDLSDANTNRVYSSLTSVYLNNLVYLGVNYKSANLVLSDLRQAVSYAIDRQSIAANAFRGYARAALFPMNTSWNQISSSVFASSVPLAGDSAKAEKLFSARGIGEEKKSIELKLVCSEASSFIRNTAAAVESALKAYNVNVTVVTMTSSELLKTVKNGDYDLYLAEIKIPVTMDLNEFFSYEGGACYGIDIANSPSASAYYKYREGTLSLDEFLEIFWDELPFIPVVFRNGRLCYTKNITSEVQAAENRIYGGIADWNLTGKAE